MTDYIPCIGEIEQFDDDGLLEWYHTCWLAGVAASRPPVVQTVWIVDDDD